MKQTSTGNIHIRDWLGRESISHEHKNLLIIVSLILGPIYLARSVYSSTLSHPIHEIPIILILSGLIFFGSAYLCQFKKYVSFLATFITIVLLSVEARLSYLEFTDVSSFLFFTPLSLIFVSLLGGVYAGIFTCLFGVGLSLFLLHDNESSFNILRLQYDFEAFTNRFLMYLVLSQVFMGIVIYFYQGSLERSVEEIKIRRFARAQTAKRAVLSETLGKAAHEINNPLAILDGSLRRLKGIDANRPDSDPEKYILFMKNAHHRLQNIMTTIKAFSSAELQKPCESVLIDDLLETLTEQVHESVLSFGVTLQIGNECPLASISCRLQQILFTLKVLVENAIEASEDHDKQIKLIIRHQGEVIHFGIQNTAQILPEEHRERFFTPFFSTKPIGKSLGMNLSICRVLIEEHGGTIGFQRESDKTQLWFTLPHVAPLSS